MRAYLALLLVAVIVVEGQEVKSGKAMSGSKAQISLNSLGEEKSSDGLKVQGDAKDKQKAVGDEGGHGDARDGVGTGSQGETMIQTPFEVFMEKVRNIDVAKIVDDLMQRLHELFDKVGKALDKIFAQR
ncbi:uncharacterized protein LOC100897231 [Galendromus occidentalis]|uniref:Uncharacterized protein LOC100897231 n=1 Tax=Galendromus occidentalis TaxID=34638 RepID=A0AAJ6QNJ1_9ACAR|nr:uncharacterized protein LOC100897231 [Galendromus occidentalis]